MISLPSGSLAATGGVKEQHATAGGGFEDCRWASEKEGDAQAPGTVPSGIRLACVSPAWVPLNWHGMETKKTGA